MTVSHGYPFKEVDHLLRNAELRDQLEPLRDESIARVNVERMTTPAENEFLASMLAWEQAPILPIARWFKPELKLTAPDQLPDEELHGALWDTIRKLFRKRIVLDFTDHLSDRQLYTLIYRDILPAKEKKLPASRNYLHWDCAHAGDDPELWLRYYATEEERSIYAEETGLDLPEAEAPPYLRDLPRAPL